MSVNLAKETSHYLSQMDDAKILIEDLTKDKDLMTVDVANLSDKVTEVSETHFLEYYNVHFRIILDISSYLSHSNCAD